MRRSEPSSLHFLYRALLVAVTFSLTLGAGETAQRIRSEIGSGERFQLTGNVHPAIVQAKDQGEVDGSTPLPRMTMHFAMTPAQKAELQQLLRLQQTRHSSEYHKWLTPEQYADRFGLNQRDMGKVTAWLEGQGFTDVIAARGRNFVMFNGTAAQVNMAFNAPIHRYVLPNGESHIANASDPELPLALRGMVAGIRGLNDIHPKPHIKVRPRFYSTVSTDNYAVPNDFATIYNIQPLYSSGITGAGRTIVVPGQTDIILGDIEAFQTASGVPVKDPQVILVPGSTDPGMQVSSGDLSESDLDLEWSGGIAKGATIVFVNSADVFTSVTYAIDQNLADVLPITYGACEAGFDPNEMSSLNGEFAQAVSQGITIVAASGDDGAADCDGGTNGNPATTATQGLAVDFPGSSEYVTSVGGTQFNEGTGTYWNTSNNSFGGSAIGYIPEVAWNEPANGVEASGGGASIVYPKPTWQTGTGVPTANARYVPDVSLDASPDHDGLLICSDNFCTNGFRNSGGYLDTTGGTSDSSPSFAAIVALLDQKYNARQGNVNPNLYLLASISSNSVPSAAGSVTSNAFNDIVSGTNIVPCTGGTPNCSSTVATINGTEGFSTNVGYDEVTGLGSINADNLLAQWTADFNLTPNPTSLTVTAGTAGTATITVSPTGNFSGSVSFTCSVASALANVTCSVPGTVTGSGSVTLTVTAASTAGTPWWRRMPTLPPGTRMPLYFLAGLLVLITGYSLKKKRPMQTFAFALTMLLVVGLSSCGGGSSSSGSTTSSPTPVAESGDVTVVATSGSLSNSTTISVSIP